MILESDPYRRLAFTFHTFVPELSKLGLDEETIAAAAAERRSKVSFDIEPVGDQVKLTVIHDDFGPESTVRRLISGGWPWKLSNLKTGAGTVMTAVPAIVDRSTWQAQIDALRVREKAHTREGDAIAAARRRLPMVEVDATTPLVGPDGHVTLLDAFEGRTQLIAYYFMWHTGHSAAEQCEGCTWCTTHVAELSYLHSRDITYAVFCQGPYDESSRYRDFMGWDMPWYSAQESLDTLLVGRQIGLMHLVCYLRDGDRVFETYWTNYRGVEAMDYSFALMDLTVFRTTGGVGRLAGRLAEYARSLDNSERVRVNGRPIAQWSRIEAGRSDDLTPK